MNQNIWGPHLWFSLHTISFNYPLKPKKEDILQYHNFFTSLQNVIPCSICKKNYIRHLKEHPINLFLNNRKDLVYWVIDMHNMVNAEIGKKILSYDIVLKKYENVYNKKIQLEPDKYKLSLLDNNQQNINSEDNIYNEKDILINEYSKRNNIYIRIIEILFVIFIILLIINFMKVQKII